MWGDTALLAVVDIVARELILFAAVGFLLGGIGDLLVDISYFLTRLTGRNADPRPLLTMDRQSWPAPMAVFIPAWDESNVIADMLRATCARWGAGDYRIYVGTYPNDPATIAAVASVAEEESRVRLVIGTNPGPTTKADCLNALWRALMRDEAAGDKFGAIILHDAEDLVDPSELRAYATWLADHDAVQIPVRPLPDARSPLIAGHYVDEFAESHSKTLVLRARLGAALPFSGVGCAIRRDMLGKVAAARGGAPFDASSLTEDYELGFAIAALGGRTKFARMQDDNGQLIAVRAYFPRTLTTAVRQKARWMTGISLAGWDRIGWARNGNWADYWMRMRDRRATLAIPLLAIAYLALILWGLSLSLHLWLGSSPPVFDPLISDMVLINLLILIWRIVVRIYCTTQAEGVVQGALALPRMFVGNLIALLAARRAITLYWPTLWGRPAVWDKTDHDFPTDVAAQEVGGA